jgi:hypothetical protein
MNKITEDKKYYTPTINEFHVGFEYEIRRFQYYDLNISDVYWDTNKFSFDFSEPNDIEDIFNEGRETGNIRVKYLDKEDIESLGLRLEQDLQDDNEFEWKIIDNNGNWIGTFLQDFNPFDEPNIIFYDTNFSIKNKFELIKLLKQLGINGQGD